LIFSAHCPAMSVPRWLVVVCLVCFQFSFILSSSVIRPGSALPDSCPTSVCKCDQEDDGWYLPYHCNCHWYYQCVKQGNGWATPLFDCGSWVFDPHQESCTFPELVPDELCNNPDCDKCPLPCQTMGNDGVCKPDCCTDADCPNGLCENGACVLGDCRKGSDCDGYPIQCKAPWNSGPNNCEYCDNMDTQATVGTCRPGCEGSSHNMCPSGLLCAGQHTCVQSGGTTIRKIHLTTQTCTGCSNSNIEGGAKLVIHGRTTECSTGNLDHENARDYSAGHHAEFTSDYDPEDMSMCANADMPGGAKSVKLTWNGAGTWTPSEVKLEVGGEYFYFCSPLQAIAEGETVTIKCSD